MEELECARLIEHTALCASAWDAYTAWEQWRSRRASRKIPLGPTLAVAFLTHRAQTQSPVSGGQRYPASLEKRVIIYSVCTWREQLVKTGFLIPQGERLAL